MDMPSLYCHVISMESAFMEPKCHPYLLPRKRIILVKWIGWSQEKQLRKLKHQIQDLFLVYLTQTIKKFDPQTNSNFETLQVLYRL